jgi:hypothetical protein
MLGHSSFPEFHGTRRFNTEFTRVLHLFVSLARPIQPTKPHPTSPRSILISTHRRHDLRSGLFPSGFPTNIHPRFDYSNYAWQRIQITKFLVMQFSPFTRHLTPLRSKYTPQHHVLNTLSLCSSLNVRDQVSHSYRTTGKIIVMYILIFKFFDSRREDRRL